VSEFHAEAPQATVSEGLAQGPYVAARAGFEPTTIRSTGILLRYCQFLIHVHVRLHDAEPS